MRVFCKLATLVIVATAAFAQLTIDQKVSDFLNVAGIYAKNYGLMNGSGTPWGSIY